MGLFAATLNSSPAAISPNANTLDHYRERIPTLLQRMQAFGYSSETMRFITALTEVTVFSRLAMT